MFRLVALVGVFVLAACVELGFRLCGVGQDLSLVRSVKGSPEVLTQRVNPTVDLAYFGRLDVSGPEPRRFDLPKPAGTYRIVFVGGSTVIGFPYAPEVAFPRQVEVLLELQRPGVDVEVLNVGITSINSFAVVDLVQQSLSCDPDLIVIHTGHNEFYGPGGPASTEVRLPAGWIRPLFAFRRLRVAQALTSLAIGGADAGDDLLDVLPRTFEIPLGSEIVRRAESNYRDNLTAAVDIARAADVPLLLTTVACNLRDQGPLRAIWPADASESVRNECLQLLSQAQSQQSGDPAAALQTLKRAETLCDRYATIHYRKGQCLADLGREEEALAAFRLARDYDGCRFRAPSRFAEIARDVAKTGKGGLFFLDVAGRIEDSFPAGPGHDLFLEHVHYHFDGHRLVGQLLARTIHESVLGRVWDGTRLPAEGELEQLLGVVPEDHIAAYSFALQVLDTKPLSHAVDLNEQRQFIVGRIAELYGELSPEEQTAFADLPMSRMMQDLVGRLAEAHISRGDGRAALKYREAAVIRRPWSFDHQWALARARRAAGETTLARKAAQTADRLQPGRPAIQAFLESLSHE